MLLDLNYYSVIIYTVVAVAVYSVIDFIVNYDGRNLPPGPWGLPFLGYYPFLQSNAHYDFAKLSKKYGSVFRIKLGINKVVVLNDYDSISEAMNKDSLIMRPANTYVANVFNNESKSGLGSWNGALWREHRKFIYRTFRYLGLGKPEMEESIKQEIVDMLGKMADHDGKPISVTNYYGPSTSNTVMRVVFGKRYDYDHPIRVKLDRLFGATNATAEMITLTGLFASFPFIFKWLLKLPIKAVSETFKILEDIHQVFDNEIAEHVTSYKEGDIRDFADAYIQECNLKKEGSTMGLNRLGGIASDVFGAASVTLKDTLAWLTLCLAKHPDIQERMYQEIVNNVGKERHPCYADRTNMPLSQAIIYEALRHGSALPISAEHSATEDSTIAGYTIPKGYTVLLNLWAVHHDPAYWLNPEQFNPDRFLSKDGVSAFRDDHVIPFSVGKRTCPGEGMALMELFLYATHIIQKFHVSPPDGVELNYRQKMNFFELITEDPLYLTFSTRS